MNQHITQSTKHPVSFGVITMFIEALFSVLAMQEDPQQFLLPTFTARLAPSGGCPTTSHGSMITARQRGESDLE